MVTSIKYEKENLLLNSELGKEENGKIKVF